MQFISLELKKYKRLMLGAIEKITFTPTALIQIILGTNGSGKSSLMYELSPLPANSQDYHAGGYKKIEISHKGSLYTLLSSFEDGQHHSFVKDGQELNPGSTVTVQKELVEMEFGITAEIRELLLGEERFTQMSPASRRIWMTKLSETNYDYAISVFMRLKERHRDAQGALRQAKKRLVTETANAPQQAEVDKLKKEIEDIYAVLQPMMEQRSPIPKSSLAYKNELSANHRQLLQRSEELVKLTQKRIDISGYQDLPAIMEHLKVYEIQESNATVQLMQFSQEYTENKEKLKLAQQAIELDTRQLLTEKKELLESLERSKASITLTLEPHRATDALSAIEAVSDSLLEVYQQLPANNDKRFSRESYQRAQERVAYCTQEDQRLQQEILRLRREKDTQEHHRDHDQTTCPRCQHSWARGYEPVRYKHIVDALEQLAAKATVNQTQLEQAKKEQLEIEMYFTTYKQLSKIQQSWPVLRHYFESVTSNPALMNNPASLILDLNTYKNQLQLLIEQSHKIKAMEDVQARLALAMKFSDTNTAGLKERDTDLTQQIERITLQLQNAQREIKHIKQCKRHYEMIHELKAQMEQLKHNHDILYAQTVATMQQETHNAILIELQTLATQKEAAYNAMINHHRLLEDIQKNIDEYVILERTAKIAMNEISPTDGLIAEGLLGFIRLFTKQMNAFIKRIWTYPLVVQPCSNADSDRVELDYRFPITVGSHLLKDASKGSTGIKEVVDLAFKVAAMQFLGLSHYPLYLDEFAASFDKEHRVAANHAIKSLMDTKMFSQLFMISHYFEGYGLFNNAEVCVLDNRNITTPQVYNTHVKIE